MTFEPDFSTPTAERFNRRLVVKLGKVSKKRFTYNGTKESLLANALSAGLKVGDICYPDIGGYFRKHIVVEKDGIIAVEMVPDKRTVRSRLHSLFSKRRMISDAAVNDSIEAAIVDPDNSLLWGPGMTVEEKREYLNALAYKGWSDRSAALRDARESKAASV